MTPTSAKKKVKKGTSRGKALKSGEGRSARKRRTDAKTEPMARRSASDDLDDLDLLLGLLDSHPVGLMIASESRKVLLWNRMAESITGYSSRDFLDSPCDSRICGRREGYCGHARDAVTTRAFRTELIRKDGRRVILGLRWSEFVAPSGRVYGIHAFSDITESVFDENAVQTVNQMLLEAAQRIQNQANTDGLTGLLNHRAFHERLRQEASRLRRREHPLSVIMFDVDHFKRCNDTYGHLFGDHALAAISRTALKTCRQEDIVARFGGEEFIVALPETSLEGAVATAERLRAAIEAMEVRDGEIVDHLTVSCGVALIEPDEIGEEMDRAVRRVIAMADQALYRAKRAGRNQVMVAEQLSD